MEKWTVRFTDAQHDIATTIENNYGKEHILRSIRMVLDGVAFVGMGVDDFELEDAAQLKIAREKFHLLKWGKYPNYSHVLQRYRLSLEIPVRVIEVQSGRDTDALLLVSYALEEDSKEKPTSRTTLDNVRVYPDLPRCHRFALKTDDVVYECDNPSLDFETSLLQICKKIKGTYLLHLCFGCLYSDYSPYGNDFFASMLCFATRANDYIKVSSKTELWDVYEDGEQVQEIFHCDRFRPRLGFPGGYRGLIY